MDPVAPIKLKCRLPLPVEALWHFWTNPEHLAMWLAAEAKVEPRQGGAYELFWDPDAPEHNSTLGCHITAWAPVSRLAFEWRGPEHLETLMPAGSTEVELRFTADGLFSTVYLHHYGWGEGEEWAEAREWQREAWNQALGGLRALLEMAHAAAQQQQEAEK